MLYFLLFFHDNNKYEKQSFHTTLPIYGDNRNHLPGNDELEKAAMIEKNHFMTRFKVAFKSSFFGERLRI